MQISLKLDSLRGWQLERIWIYRYVNHLADSFRPSDTIAAHAGQLHSSDFARH